MGGARNLAGRLMSRRSFTKLAALGLGLGPTACLSPKSFNEAAWRDHVAATLPAKLYAPHRNQDGAFFNPWQEMDFGMGRLLRWRLSSNSVEVNSGRWEKAPRVANDAAYLRRPGAPASLTWVGHATYALHWSGQVVLTDPHFGGEALVVPRLVDPGIGLDALPHRLVCVLSHNHYDHMDRSTIALLGRRADWVCPLGLGDDLRAMGAGRVKELDWWQTAVVGGTEFTCLPAQHWSLRMMEKRNRTLWGSFLMRRNGKSVYFCGDSGYFRGFAEFGRRWPGIDVAIMPIGAYQPRWFMHYAHMNVAEALAAFEDLGARRFTPMQWGVFKLGDEPAGYPIKDLRDILARRPELGRRAKVLPVGGRMSV